MSTNKLTCLTAKYGIATETMGNAKTCCMARDALVDDTGNQMRFDTHTPSQFWNSSHRREILEALDAGIQHPNCIACWEEENAGGKISKRLREQHLWEKYEQDYPDVMGPPTPLYIDMKFGNTCNLRCRTCNSYNSSAWQTEQFDVYFKGIADKRKFLDRFEPARISYSDDNPLLWEEFEQWILQSKRIDFYGGEPLLITKPWKMLHKCIEAGVSETQYLHCNTNGTIFPSEEQIDVFTKFQTADIALSIDGIEQAFEYMRHPAKWDVVLENIDKFYELKRKHPSIKISFCYTLSISNIHHITEFDRFIRNRYGVDAGIWYNMLYKPDHYKITNLPREIKLELIQKITSYISEYKEANEWNFDTLRNVTTHLMSESPSEKHFSNFYIISEKHDKYKNQKFSEYFPKWSRQLEAYR